MKNYEDYQVINGTWGEVWVDDDYMAEVIGLEAKIKLETTDVNQSRRMSKGQKVTGTEGSGTLKLNKVSSYFIKKMSENMKKGKTTTASIISNLADPDALGNERIKLSGCLFSELTLADWEMKKNGEESIPFTFTDFEILDAI